jgi:hypothetical protein
MRRRNLLAHEIKNLEKARAVSDYDVTIVHALPKRAVHVKLAFRSLQLQLAQVCYSCYHFHAQQRHREGQPVKACI